MSFADFVPGSGEGNLSTYYRNAIGVPLRRRTVVVVLTLFVFFLIIILALILNKPLQPPTIASLTSPLYYVRLEDSINSSIDPCDNFYRFACGSWTPPPIDPENRPPEISTFTLLQQHVDHQKRQIFDGSIESNDNPCVVNDAIKFNNLCSSRNVSSEFDLNYFLDYFEQALGGWPILHPNRWNESDFDIVKASAYLFKTLNIQTMINIVSVLDDKNTSQKLFRLSPPDNTKEIEPILYPFQTYLLSLVLENLNHTDIEIDDLTETFLQIAETGNKWKDMFYSTKSSRDPTDQVRMTFSELKQLPFDWLYYIQLITNDSLESDQVVTEDDEVFINNYSYFLNVSQNTLNEFSKRDVANLFGWFVVTETWFFVPGVIDGYMKGDNTSDEEIAEFVKSKCFDYTFELYDCSFDYLYVKNMSRDKHVSDGSVLVHYVKQAIKALIENSDWLDNSTRDSAVLKLNSMKSIVGFPPYLNNREAFDKLYKDYPTVQNTALKTFVEIRTFYVKCLANDVKAKHQVRSFGLLKSVTDIGAYYDVQRNVITLPLSSFDLPFYHNNGWYHNFGGMGSIIGHETTHGFGKTGSTRDETGSLRNWWSDLSLEIFRERLSCFDLQYSSDIHNTSSIDEDIADSEGLRASFMAYKLWQQEHKVEKSSISQYTPDQMFFLSYASIWCSELPLNSSLNLKYSLPEIRVNGAVSNFESFSHAFQCPNNSPMNPSKKCQLW